MDRDRLLREIHALLDAERGVEAEHLAASAVQQFPQDPEVHLAAAIAWIERDPQQSRDWGREAGEHAADPGIQFRAASLLFDLGDLDGAKTLARRVREVVDEDFPLIADLINLIGRIAAEKGDLASAEYAFRWAFEDAPDVSAHARDLVALLLDQDRGADLRPVVRAALEHHPTDTYLLEVRDWLAAEGRVGRRRRGHP